MKIKVFDYITELDCFVVREEFRTLMERLDITEWTPVVWICRLFALDNDFGEHIFDNWEEREQLKKKMEELGKKELVPYSYDESDLMIVIPDRFVNHEPYCISCHKRIGRKAKCPECGEDISVGPDGPCHKDKQRKRFWTDVFKCLELDLETIFEEARSACRIPDEMKFVGEPTRKRIEEEIQIIKSEYNYET